MLLGLAGVFAWLIPWLLEEPDNGRRLLKAAASEAAAKAAPTPAHARQPLSHFSLQYQDDNSGCRRSITELRNFFGALSLPPALRLNCWLRGMEERLAG